MPKKRNQKSHSVQSKKSDPKKQTKDQIPPSDTLRITPPPTDATPLTEKQRLAIRQEQEAVMRQHKGDVLIYYRALSFIAKAKAYRPQFKRIDDYAWQVHQIRSRTWHKQMTYVEINEAYRAYLKQKCPNVQISENDELISKEKAKCFEGLKKHPHLLEAAFDEVGQNAKDVLTFAVQQIARKFKKLALGEKITAMTAKEIDDRFSDWFVHGDMLTTPAIKPNHFDMIITSIPYGLRAIKYDVYNDNISPKEHRQHMELWCERMRWSLKTTGRACINLANVEPKQSKSKDIYINTLPVSLCNIMERFGDMHLYQWITWNRGFLTENTDKHWGSYHSCSHPNVRRLTESVVIFAKGSTKRKAVAELRDITEAAFKSWSYDIWRIGPDSTVKWHPCPFPLEIPIRLMQLYGQEKDKILDPFGGSGTTALAAAMLNRECLSVEVSPDYTDLGRRRLIEYLDSGKAKKRLDSILRRAEQGSGEEMPPSKNSD